MEKYVSLEANNVVCAQSCYELNKSTAVLDGILKKCFDYEENSIDYDDINRIIDLYQKVPHYQLRSPFHFTLGYLAAHGRDWNNVWRLMDWLSKWAGQSLNPVAVVMYYRYIQRTRR
jgi:hypothetical protein